MGKTARRWGLAMVAVAALLSGCTATHHDAHRRAPAAPTSPAAEGAPAPVSRVAAARLYPSGLGLVAVETDRRGAVRTRLLLTRDHGATLADITPPGLPRRNAVVDDLAAQGRRRLWLLTWSPDSEHSRLYRSADAGRTWSASAVPGHNAAAGSQDTIAFADPRHGWLAQQMPNGPLSRLYATVDGGARWRLVDRRLRQVALVVAQGRRTLWQAGGGFSDRLLRSADGGRAWTRTGLPGVTTRVRAEPAYAAPGVFGARLVEVVGVLGRRGERLRFYGSDDAGRSWRPRATLGPFDEPTADGMARRADVGFAGPTAWWVVAATPQPTVLRTVDAGRHWQRTPLPGMRYRGRSVLRLSVGDARHAWVTVTDLRHGDLLSTSDGGRTWTAVTPAP